MGPDGEHETGISGRSRPTTASDPVSDGPTARFQLFGLSSSFWSFTLLVAIAFALLHSALVWGRVDAHIWRDVGRWLHELERYTDGETPYRDFVWLYPPLSLWVLGAVTRLSSADLVPVWLTTAGIYLLICVAYCRYAALLLPRAVVPAVVLAGLLLSAGYAQNSSAPLPLGMYTPAAPIGFLLLLGACLLVLRLLENASLIRALVAGALCGSVVLTKQDFWLPAAYLVAAGGLIMWRTRQQGLRDAIAMAAASVAVISAGAVVIGVTAGWQQIPGVVFGFGNTEEVGAHSLPSGFRITTQLFVIATITLWLQLIARATGSVPGISKRRLVVNLLLIAACAGLIAVKEGLRLGAGLTSQGVEAVVREFALGITLQAMPILLTVLSLGVLLVRWHRFDNRPLRNTVAFLLGLYFMSGVRRGFEYTEWFHFLLGLPAYTLLVMLLLGRYATWRVNAVRLSFAVLLVLALGAHWYWGIGPLTHEPEQVAVPTPHGVVLLGEPMARQYAEVEHAVDVADPSHTRPLLSFGYSGSFNYFLDREAASPLTAGFRLSSFDARAVTSSLLRQPDKLLLIDVERFKRGRRPVLTATGLLAWRLPTRPSFFVRFDRQFFNQIATACRGRPTQIFNLYKQPVMTVLDCARRNRPATPLRTTKEAAPKPRAAPFG